MHMSRHQNAGQKHNTKRENMSFEYLAKFEYLDTTIKTKITFTRQ